MEPGVIVAILVLVGSALGSLVTYLVGIRKFSGSVKDSDAESLWSEVRALTQEYKEQIAECRKDLEKCMNENGTLAKERDHYQELLKRV